MVCKVKKMLQGSFGLLAGISLMAVGAMADIEDDYPHMSKGSMIVIDNQTDNTIAIDVTTRSKTGGVSKKLLSYSPRNVSAYAFMTEENINLVRIDSVRMGMIKCSTEGAMKLPYDTDIYSFDEFEDYDDTKVSFVVTQKINPALGRSKKESRSCQVSLRRHS